ncbi:MAG: hypothetical protein JSS62_01265 [Verrucomicrobia bacterium]|nr:hypothetical protein [Verrucomicrobiota bacterium]MBS0646098.1 hypothetical protein [Verrucomicrobiota bacterium]
MIELVYNILKIMDSLNSCRVRFGRCYEGLRDSHPCLKALLVTSVAMLAIGLAAAWIPSMPSSLISPFIKIGGSMMGSLIFFKCTFGHREAASQEGRRIKITLLAGLALIIGGAVVQGLLSGGPSAIGQAALYMGIPLGLSSLMSIATKRFSPEKYKQLQQTEEL